MNIFLHRLTAITTVFILITSCATTTGKPETSSQKMITKARELAKSGDYQQSAIIYQQLAEKQKPPVRDKLLLRALDLFVKSGEFRNAVQSATELNPSSLSSRERVLYHLLYGKSEVKLGHPRNALKELDQISPGLLARPEQKLYHILRVKTFERLDQRMAVVKERIKLARLLDEGDEFAHNNRQIAKVLTQMKPEMLRHQRSSSPQTLRGWIDYILITQATLPDSPERERYLQRWRDQYPGHTAIYSEISPKGETGTRQIIGAISTVAVILPHSGPYTYATHAIKQGMLTARDEQQAMAVPAIRFYDSTAGNITTIYQRAVTDGADLVIGPLQKQTLQELLQSISLDKPLLALNQLDGVTRKNLYQIGLNPRDEIEQAAAMAWQDGHRRALVLVSETRIGERAAQIFSDYWKALGGEILEITRYPAKTKELSKSVSTLLNLDESMARRRRLQSLVGKLEFTSRSRTDADMIFMMAKPTVARIIRPLLSFYRVNQLSVYATSRVYSGKPDPAQDRDLSGIVFCSNTSKFDQDELQRQREIANQYQIAERNIPLFNLGYDAYRMISGIAVLQQDPDQRIHGKTGVLWMDDNNNIRRQLICGQFQDGTVRVIGPAPVLIPEGQIIPSLFERQSSELDKKPWLERSDRVPVN